MAFSGIGVHLEWSGEGESEIGVDIKTNRVLVKVSKEFFRPLDVENLLGDPKKAQSQLGWSRKIPFHDMIKEMVEEDISCLS